MTKKSPTEILDLSFRAALQRLDAAGLLLKVEDEVDWDLELTSILYREPERAMLFKRVKGYSMPVVGNLFGSEENLLTIYQQDVPGLRQYIPEGLSHPIPPKSADSGPVQEVFHDNPDLIHLLPMLRYAPNDGGRYISAGVVIAKDQETGVSNASYHRFMYVEENRMALKIDQGRHLRVLWERAKSKGEPLPIAVVLGADMGTLYAGATMGAQLPFALWSWWIVARYPCRCQPTPRLSWKGPFRPRRRLKKAHSWSLSVSIRMWRRRPWQRSPAFAIARIPSGTPS
jgi:2,5-furandicarboxylate decarboxylase 1